MVGKIDDFALVLAVNCGMRFVDKIGQPFRMPMIPARISLLAIHALLDHCPLAVVSNEEAVEVKVEAVLYRRAVNLGDETACARQRSTVKPNPHPEPGQFVRRPARMLTPTAAHMNAQFARERGQSALECADHTGGDAG